MGLGRHALSRAPSFGSIGNGCAPVEMKSPEVHGRLDGARTKWGGESADARYRVTDMFFRAATWKADLIKVATSESRAQ